MPPSDIAAFIAHKPALTRDNSALAGDFLLATAPQGYQWPAGVLGVRQSATPGCLNIAAEPNSPLHATLTKFHQVPTGNSRAFNPTPSDTATVPLFDVPPTVLPSLLLTAPQRIRSELAVWAINCHGSTDATVFTVPADRWIVTPHPLNIPYLCSIPRDAGVEPYYHGGQGIHLLPPIDHVYTYDATNRASYPGAWTVYGPGSKIPDIKCGPWTASEYANWQTGPRLDALNRGFQLRGASQVTAVFLDPASVSGLGRASQMGKVKVFHSARLSTLIHPRSGIFVALMCTGSSQRSASCRHTGRPIREANAIVHTQSPANSQPLADIFAARGFTACLEAIPGK